ncbi:MAG: hypothetical protein A2X12_08235 [Bacteroidetes bacterium GWE2_29_8]|nr:MAG: hypothetical protein A2X12_08235 [Bacteroidetes bacterium GWE2_29_8]OFY20786.1 MAG: hypothetical protein A2X02_08565 [Bacteroidetes bacterium GWF2_29_10]
MKCSVLSKYLFKIKYFYILIFAIFLIFACKKDKINPVPDTLVDIYLNISSTQYIRLTTIEGFEYVTGGVSGILVYRKSLDEFMAFDRMCPYNSSSCERIQVQSTPIAVDSGCGTTFLMLDGSVIAGPSKFPLKQYKTYFDGSYLRIYNN